MKIASNGIAIHAVECQGAGDPSLVFLHYWGGSSRTWQHVTARLAPAFRTIAIDHRGWGRSDAPPAAIALADLAADAAGSHRGAEPRQLYAGRPLDGRQGRPAHGFAPAAGLAGLVLVAPSPPSPMIMPAQAREIMANAYASRETVQATIDKC